MSRNGKKQEGTQRSFESYQKDRQEATFADLSPMILNWIESNDNDFVSVCKWNGEILYVSKSIKKILGFAPSTVIGTVATDYLSPEDQKNLQALFDNRKEKEQKFRLYIRDVNDKYIWMETTVSPLSELEGEKVYISVTRDITEKKETEEMMVRSEKMSLAGQLAAGVAHEIRNPLTSLRGFLQLLQTGIEEKSTYYDVMEEELRKIESITSELLFVSKPLTDEKKPEKITPLLRDVILLLHSEAKLAGIDISLEGIEDVKVNCDRSQIKQVFINLIKNAVESMEKGGKIEVVVKKEEEKELCQVDVVDEGPGVSPDIVHKLTEPFFTTKKQGTGLGLMITNQIIQGHGGKLDIYPNEIKGSCFRVSLPLHTEKG